MNITFYSYPRATRAEMHFIIRKYAPVVQPYAYPIIRPGKITVSTKALNPACCGTTMHWSHEDQCHYCPACGSTSHPDPS